MRVLRVGFDGRALASPAPGVRRYSYELFGALADDDAWPLEKVDRDDRLGVLRKTAS